MPSAACWKFVAALFRPDSQCRADRGALVVPGVPSSHHDLAALTGQGDARDAPYEGA
jgi:hypothetical protein